MKLDDARAWWKNYGTHGHGTTPSAGIWCMYMYTIQWCINKAVVYFREVSIPQNTYAY